MIQKAPIIKDVFKNNKLKLTLAPQRHYKNNLQPEVRYLITLSHKRINTYNI